MEEWKEQLKLLIRQQNETENAYWENIGMEDKSILAQWAEEILQREEQIKALKQKIAEQAEESKMEVEASEEKSLVDTRKLTPFQWMRQQMSKIKTIFKLDSLDNVPGIPKEKLQDIRDKKMNQYKAMLNSYRAQNTQVKKEEEFGILTTEQKEILEKNVLNHKNRVSNVKNAEKEQER